MAGGAQLCFILFMILALGFLAWGLSDLLRKRQPTEASTVDTISRKISGFGLIVVAQLVIMIGLIVCYGVSGGAKGFGESLAGVMHK